MEPGEYWGLDPQDVRRHARRMRQARSVGPLGKVVRGAAVMLVLVGAFLVTWNFDTLRQARFDFSAVRDLFDGDAPEGARPSDEPGIEVIEDSSIAGAVSLPTSIDKEPAPESPNAEAPANDAPAAAAEEAPRSPPPPPEPELPVRPETIGFGLEAMNVSEASASAAVLVLRDGGRRQVSFFTWWTTDGEATAGSDFARLDRRVERFGVGEQNRTIHVPIVGDRATEGPENFSVHIALGDSLTALEAARIEIVIDDDE